MTTAPLWVLSATAGQSVNTIVQEARQNSGTPFSLNEEFEENTYNARG
jgi:hypothetical protein